MNHDLEINREEKKVSTWILAGRNLIKKEAGPKEALPVMRTELSILELLLATRKDEIFDGRTSRLDRYCLC